MYVCHYCTYCHTESKTIFAPFDTLLVPKAPRFTPDQPSLVSCLPPLMSAPPIYHCRTCDVRRARDYFRRAKQEAADLAEVEHFALKALAKKAVVDRGQLAHVKDEKLLLQNMVHPLILGLFSTFQVRP